MHNGKYVNYLSSFLFGSDQNATVYKQTIIYSNENFMITFFSPKEEVAENNIEMNGLNTYGIVYLTFKTEHFTDSSYVEFLTLYANMIRAITIKYYLIIDTFQMTINNKKRLLGVVKSFTQINQSLSDYHMHKLLCTCVIISSPLVKVFINSVIGMFYKPLRPFGFFCSYHEFFTFLTKNLNSSDTIYGSISDTYAVDI